MLRGVLIVLLTCGVLSVVGYVVWVAMWADYD